MAEGDVIADCVPFPPHLYPWTDGLPRTDVDVAIDRDVAPTADPAPHTRVSVTDGDHLLVVAVGSNASPDVMRHKLCAPTAPPMTPVRIDHLAIGHSAHVSRRGYIAAAPWRSTAATTRATACVLTPDQIATLDVTEPNYVRVRLSTNDFPMRSVDGASIDGTFDIYDSLHGLVSDPTTGMPLPFTDQQTLFAHMSSTWSEWGHGTPARDVCEMLSQADAADRVGAHLHAAAVDSGLSEFADSSIGPAEMF